jgi:hypothetical protein
MRWKEFDIWFKGAIFGLIIAMIVSIGIGQNIPILSFLSLPGVDSCYLLTHCTGNICTGCLVIGFMINLFYGYVIGAIIGGIIQYNTNKTKTRKKIKRNKNGKKG